MSSFFISMLVFLACVNPANNPEYSLSFLRLIEGLSIENPAELTNMICDLMSK